MKKRYPNPKRDDEKNGLRTFRPECVRHIFLVRFRKIVNIKFMHYYSYFSKFNIGILSCYRILRNVIPLGQTTFIKLDLFERNVDLLRHIVRFSLQKWNILTLNV